MTKSKNSEGIYHHKPSTLEVLSALMGEYQWLKLVADKHPEHETLINAIHEMAVREEYEKVSIKDLANNTGQKPAVTTRLIHQLYEDIWLLNEEKPELFKRPGLRYNLCFMDGYSNESLYFTLWLKHVLNYGDSFEWGFIRAKQQTYSYYVSKIKHDYANGKHTVDVTLRSGSFNLYRQMLFDKACVLDLLGIEEQYRLTDYELDRLLVHRVEKDRDGYPESLAYLEKRKFKY